MYVILKFPLYPTSDQEKCFHSISTCFEESQELWNSNAGVWDGRVERKRGLGTINQMPMLAKLVKFMQTRAPLGHNLVLYMKTVLQMTVA